MQNTIFHNRKILATMLDMREYWDFRIALSRYDIDQWRNRFGVCLSAFVDTTIPSCHGYDGELVSLPQYTWDKGVNKGVLLENIGFTGIDNGIIRFDRETTSNDEFLDLFTKSSVKLEEGDLTLKLHPVTGNTGLYSYPNEMVVVDDMTVAELKGGFFQGIFKHGDGCDYSILPSDFTDGVCLEFALMPKRFDDIPDDSYYNLHPENHGIFFYMGTRAENKWWKYYNTDEKFEETGIVQPEHTYPENENIDFVTTDGNSLKETNIIDIETDNGFLMFDHTKDGITAKDYEEGMTVSIRMPDINPSENYFQIVHHGKGGYDANTVQDLEKEELLRYSVMKDLYGNALAFMVTESGMVGYRYLVRDCDNKDGYSIKSEFSDDGVVKHDEWSVITVRVVPVYIVADSVCYTGEGRKEFMNLLFYVNGKLELVSKPLPYPDFRLLDDPVDKQEGVPFNISLGGGTQGLSEVIYPDWLKYPEYILPLEKHFGGSFSGYIKSFKFFTCDKDYEIIRESVGYEFADIRGEICRDGFGDIYGVGKPCNIINF